MEHLNYCRQMVKQFSAPVAAPDFPEHFRKILNHCINLSKVSVKFMLPEGGRIYDDKEYRGLDDSEPLRLPYPNIALEYSRNTGGKELTEYEGLSTKTIIFARESEDAIIFQVVMWVDFKKTWGPLPEAAIPRIGYLNRSKSFNGYTGINMWRADQRIPLSDYADEAGALMCFLNVLACNNVHVERSEPKKATRKIKAAFPFDTYHVLIIDVPNKTGERTHSGSHRSPREHLRRGHIRRIADGRRIWVNATVVAAGRGAGVVTKSYAVRPG